MQEILKGRQCLLRVNIASVGAVQTAIKIDTHLISPSGVSTCISNGYDELAKTVEMIISGDLLNELGAYSIDMRLVFAGGAIVVPTFAFAEVVASVDDCEAVSIVDITIQAGEVEPGTPTPTINVVGREEFDQLSNKVSELDEGQSNFIEKEQGKGLSSNDYTDADKAEVAKIKDKADQSEVEKLGKKLDNITITQKDNGNIVLLGKEFMPATPSGDALHYMYEGMGAIYNATSSNITRYNCLGVNNEPHLPNHWYLNGLGNITTEEMGKIYCFGLIQSFDFNILANNPRANIRTNACRLGGYNMSSSSFGFSNLAYANTTIEVINLCYAPQSGNTFYEGFFNVTTLADAFNECSNLRSIRGLISPYSTNVSTSNAFKGCAKLELVKLRGWNGNVSFSDSPILSKDALLYLITNCASSKTFTITLHSGVYAKCVSGGEWYSEVNTALQNAKTNKSTNITLASA